MSVTLSPLHADNLQILGAQTQEFVCNQYAKVTGCHLYHLFLQITYKFWEPKPPATIGGLSRSVERWV